MNSSRGIERVSSLTIFFLPVLVLFIIFLLPLVTILQNGFISPRNELNISYILFVFEDRVTWHFFKFTILQACLSTFLTLVIGLPGAYYFARYDFIGKKYLRALLTVPFVLPPIVVLIGFISLFGSEGIAKDFIVFIGQFFIFQTEKPETLFDPILFPEFSIFSYNIRIPGLPIGILLTHAFYNIPIVIRLGSATLEQRDPELDDIAETLGSRGFHRFRRLFITQVLPGLLASGFLTFFYCFTSFAIVLYFGGVRYQTLEVKIFKLSRDYSRREYLNFASGLAIIQILVCIFLLVTYYYLLKDAITKKAARTDQAPTLSLFRNYQISVRTKILFLLYLIFITLFLLSPLISIFYESLFDNGHLTFSAYETLLKDDKLGLQTSPRKMVENSLSYAFITLIIATIIGVFSASAIFHLKRTNHHKTALIYSILFLAPIATSGVTLGLGMLRLFGSENLYYHGSFFIVLTHILVAIPFVNRAVNSAYEKVDPDLIEVSQTLGANRLRVFVRVELPLLFPGIVAAAVFAVAISFGEFGASYFIGATQPNQATMVVGIYQLLRPGGLQLSAAMASILIIICVTSFLIFDKTRQTSSLI